MVLGGEIKDTGRKATIKTTWFTLVTEWWWLVKLKILGEKRQSMLHGLYGLLNGGGWCTEIQ
jgi:hypothetical protein